jgi:hypothetical protein
MRAHVTTIVETVFTEWYSTAARWDAPGATTEFVCVHCVGSRYSIELGLAEWPHDVTHQLVATLADITRGVGELFGEPDVTLDDIVLAAVRAHAADVHDVLVECVEPRLNAYLRREAASIDSEFGLLAES